VRNNVFGYLLFGGLFDYLLVRLKFISGRKIMTFPSFTSALIVFYRFK